MSLCKHGNGVACLSCEADLARLTAENKRLAKERNEAMRALRETFVAMCTDCVDGDPRLDDDGIYTHGTGAHATECGASFAREMHDEILAMRALDASQPQAKTCGCVICTCEDEEQCHGCGARQCDEHKRTPASDEAKR